ncbi:FUSC family protein [Serratia marcescens]|uniref:FUSC family protein n=1 Tax=Serratia marcescens TaxID=615 RepID=A0A939NR98_SERMA|nr:FUSC family protein [Serratia marcescens]
MNLPFLEWSRTPGGKATGGQWRHALRNSLAMCLALWVAFVLELDEPSWALTSAAVVSFHRRRRDQRASRQPDGCRRVGDRRPLSERSSAVYAVHRRLGSAVHLYLQPLKQRLLRVRAGGLYHHRLRHGQRHRYPADFRYRAGAGFAK